MFDENLNPETLFEERMRTLIKENEEADSEKTILNLIELLMYKERVDNGLFEIIKLFGINGLAKLVNLFNGRTVTFPKRDEFKQYIELVIAFYYRKYHGKMDWKWLREHVGNPDISSVSFGLRINSFEKWMVQELEEHMAKIYEKEQENERRNKGD
jgi:hypothetical protein